MLTLTVRNQLKNSQFFYLVFDTSRTIAHFSMSIMCRNLTIKTETLIQSLFQKTRSYWASVKRFGVISGIEVEKCVKNETKNQQFINLEDTSRSGMSQWRLVVHPMLWPYMSPVQSCNALILPCNTASPATIFSKNIKKSPCNRLRGSAPRGTPVIRFSDKRARKTGIFLKSCVLSRNAIKSPPPPFQVSII